MSPRHANALAVVHAGAPRLSANAPWCASSTETAAAIVRSAWMRVPVTSHARVFAPMRSPMRPRNAPKMKESTDVSACWSAMWKDVSRWPAGPWKSRASAMASWADRRV
jgi:hypothetical protein